MTHGRMDGPFHSRSRGWASAAPRTPEAERSRASPTPRAPGLPACRPRWAAAAFVSLTPGLPPAAPASRLRVTSALPPPLQAGTVRPHLPGATGPEGLRLDPAPAAPPASRQGAADGSETRLDPARDPETWNGPGSGARPAAALRAAPAEKDVLSSRAVRKRRAVPAPGQAA